MKRGIPIVFTLKIRKREKKENIINMVHYDSKR